MGKPNSSNNDTKEIILKVLSVIWTVVWTLIKWSFIITIWTITMFLACAGLAKFPEIPRDDRRRPREFDSEKFRKELEDMRVKDLLNKAGEELDKADRNNLLNPEEKKLVQKFRELDRNQLRFQLKQAISDEEMEILFSLLIKILSGDLR